VTQQALEGVGVATISQEIDGKGVTEAVGISIGDASAFSEATDEVTKCVTGERSVQMIRKQWVVRTGVGTGGQVTPDGLGCGAVYIHGALFGPFAPDEDTFVAFVHIGDGDFAEFTGADASINKGLDDGSVAESSGATPATVMLASDGMGLGVAAGGKYGFSVVLCIRFDGRFFRLGADYFLEDVLLD
jgi:hypothetical protein